MEKRKRRGRIEAPIFIENRVLNGLETSLEDLVKKSAGKTTKSVVGRNEQTAREEKELPYTRNRSTIEGHLSIYLSI